MREKGLVSFNSKWCQLNLRYPTLQGLMQKKNNLSGWKLMLV